MGRRWMSVLVVRLSCAQPGPWDFDPSTATLRFCFIADVVVISSCLLHSYGSTKSSGIF